MHASARLERRAAGWTSSPAGAHLYPVEWHHAVDMAKVPIKPGPSLKMRLHTTAEHAVRCSHKLRVDAASRDESGEAAKQRDLHRAQVVRW